MQSHLDDANMNDAQPPSQDLVPVKRQRDDVGSAALPTTMLDDDSDVECVTQAAAASGPLLLSMQAMLESAMRKQTRTLCRSIQQLQSTATEAQRAAQSALDTVATLKNTVDHHQEQLHHITTQLGELQRRRASSEPPAAQATSRMSLPADDHQCVLVARGWCPFGSRSTISKKDAGTVIQDLKMRLPKRLQEVVRAPAPFMSNRQVLLRFHTSEQCVDARTALTSSLAREPLVILQQEVVVVQQTPLERRRRNGLLASKADAFRKITQHKPYISWSEATLWTSDDAFGVLIGRLSLRSKDWKWMEANIVSHFPQIDLDALEVAEPSSE
eukprot:2793160-Amphidinium_carterae.2